MISIITPVYNRQDLIAETVNSVINQSYTKWELLIIDDKSTDKSREIITYYSRKDFRVKFFLRKEEPKGANVCRNIGIKNAKGDFIVFLDSDDMLKPFALEKRMNVINQNPDFDFWVFQTIRFQDNPYKESAAWAEETEQDNLQRFLKPGSVWHTTGPIWKASCFKKNLKFDEKLACWQDVDFHLQALYKNLKYKTFFNLPADVLYREHSEDSISQKGFSKEKRESQIYFLKKYYRLLTNPEHRRIIKNLTETLGFKNAQSRYFFNMMDIIFWGIKTQSLSFNQVIRILKTFV